MKGYKHIYGISLVYTWFKVMLLCAPALFVTDLLLVFVKMTGQAFGKMSFGLLASFALLGAAFVACVLLIHMFVLMFGKEQMFLGEGKVRYGKKTIVLHEVQEIKVLFPELRGRGSCDPHEVIIYANDREDILIKRPSISFLYDLKQACPGTEFILKGSGWKINLIVMLFAVALCAVLTLLDTTWFDRVVIWY